MPFSLSEFACLKNLNICLCIKEKLMIACSANIRGGGLRP